MSLLGSARSIAAMRRSLDAAGGSWMGRERERSDLDFPPFTSSAEARFLLPAPRK